jgi:hypothetical protein
MPDMEWVPALIGYFVIIAASVGVIAISFSAVAFGFERRDLALKRDCRELCRTEIALAIQMNAEMFEEHPDVKQLLKEVASEIVAKKSGGYVSFDKALDVFESSQSKVESQNNHAS